MLTISVIIDSSKDDIKDVSWPENSYPLYFQSNAYGSIQEFPLSRIIPDATLEQITFLKLSGFTVYESNQHAIETQDGKHIIANIRSSDVIRTSAT